MNKILKGLFTFLILLCIAFIPSVFADEIEEVPNEIDAEKINEIHKVSTEINKVDENGNALKGATLQILDSNGIILDEWISDGTVHSTLLPEGEYILHEVVAPEGYVLAPDKTFKVEVIINEINAGADFSETPCEHYGGTPLYYVEIDGTKSEVYCINQDLETPDDNSKYDGAVVTPDNIRNFTNQTVYVDAHQNTSKIDVSDQSLSSEELYDKILDIVYHRQKASDIFEDLSEAEIRYVTELALKNYTNTNLTRVQRVGKSNVPENYQNFDNYTTDDGKYVWYLYPWYRSFIYDPTQPLGKDIFRTVIGEGDAFGTLARHWSSGHNAKNSLEVREKIARYYELYTYLISDSDHHLPDMYLYIYSSNNKTEDASSFNFDEGAYQNLLGITWFNPYNEDFALKLDFVNKSKEITPLEEDKKITHNPQTGDNIEMYFTLMLTSVFALAGVMILNKKML